MGRSEDHRIVWSLLIADLLLTLLMLYGTALQVLREPRGDVQYTSPAWPWQLSLAVVAIWLIVFLLLRPHSAAIAGTLVELAGSLLAAVALAAVGLAGGLFLASWE